MKRQRATFVATGLRTELQVPNACCLDQAFVMQVPSRPTGLSLRQHE